MSKQVNSNFVRLLGFVVLAAGSAPHAAETLEGVMARMRPQQAQAIEYQERRTLSLLAKPWDGSGFLYAAPPDRLLKQQLKPEIELMGIQGEQLWYFNAASQQRHHADSGSFDDLDMNLATFKGLLGGDLKYLQKMYNLEFGQDAKQWHLLLSDKRLSGGEKGIKVSMRGAIGKAAEQLILTFPDGDSSEFRLKPPVQGPKVEQSLQALFKQLQESP